MYDFFMWRCGPTGAMASSFSRFLDKTQWGITACRTPLDEWSAHRRDLYLTTHNTHKRQTSIPPVGFKPTIPVSERPQNHSLDRAATGIGDGKQCLMKTKDELNSMQHEELHILSSDKTTVRSNY